MEAPSYDVYLRRVFKLVLMFIRGGKGILIAIIYVLPDTLSLLFGSLHFPEQFLAFYLSS
jgi:hypothetical protein